jgi:hypothetical protein
MRHPLLPTAAATVVALFVCQVGACHDDGVREGITGGDAADSGDPADADADAGIGGAGGDADAPNDGIAFAPRLGLDPGGLARPIGKEFSVFASTLRSNSAGQSWLLWDSFANQDFGSRTPHLDHFDVDGTRIGSSSLAALDPASFVLHQSGSLSAWHGFCRGTDATCFYKDDGRSITERVWSPDLRPVATWQLDWHGDVVGTADVEIGRRAVLSGAAAGDGLYVLTNEGDTRIHGLDGNGAPVWSVEVLPRVAPPPLPVDAPTVEVIRQNRLANQTPAKIVAVDGGVVVAAVVTRGTLAALAASRGVVLPLPTDPLCHDVVIARISADGQQVQYWSVPTLECEALPQLAVVAGHAVVASWISVAIPPAPNDTSQYDVALAVLDLSSGGTVRTTIGFSEDDIVEALAPCGPAMVCLAGMTGTRSVDTGSRVTFGDGFVLPVSLSGTLGARWSLRSERHTTIPLLAPRDDGSVLFFATVDGPITHTADGDQSLRYNRGVLGIVSVATP